MSDQPRSWEELSRLTEQERIELFTLMGQWSRLPELQAAKVSKWFIKRQADFAQLVAEEARVTIVEVVPGTQRIAPRLRTDAELRAAVARRLEEK